MISLGSEAGHAFRACSQSSGEVGPSWQEPTEVILQNQQETVGILRPLGGGGCQKRLGPGPAQAGVKVALVDLKAGKVTPFLAGLNRPHGILFLPKADDESSDDAGE